MVVVLPRTTREWTTTSMTALEEILIHSGKKLFSSPVSWTSSYCQSKQVKYLLKSFKGCFYFFTAKTLFRMKSSHCCTISLVHFHGNYERFDLGCMNSNECMLESRVEKQHLPQLVVALNYHRCSNAGRELWQHRALVYASLNELLTHAVEAMSPQFGRPISIISDKMM